MASLETLSDGELRRKLSEFGYPVGPVTDTTRKILFKKLKQFLEKQSSDEVPGKKSRGSLSRFSSGEEESEADEDSLTMPPPVSKTSPRSSSRRKSTGVKHNVSSSKTSSRSDANSHDISDGGQRDSALKTRNTTTISPASYDSNLGSSGSRNRRSTRLTNDSFAEGRTSLRRDGFETGSDSDVAGEEPVTDFSDGNVSSSRSYLSSVSSRLGFSTERTNVSNTYEPRRRQPTKSDSRPYTPNGHHSFTSSFTTHKVSSPSSPSTSLPSSHPLSPFSVSNKQRAVPMISTQFGTAAAPVEEEKKFWDSQSVSMVLVVVAALFFLAIGVTYMSVRYKDSSISSALDAVSRDVNTQDNNYPLCSDNPNAPQENCVDRIFLQPALELFRLLQPWLEEKAAKAQCDVGWFGGSQSVNAAVMSHSKVVEHLAYMKDVCLDDRGIQKIDKCLKNLKIIIQRNPKWGVKVISAADAISLGLDAEEYYVVPEPTLSWGCVLWLKAVGLIISALAVGGGFFTLWWCQVGISWHLRRKERHQKEVYRLVEQAITLLSAHQQHQASLGSGADGSASGEGAYLAINHVRDQLIPPSERQKKAALWEEVVQFLEERESRVRMEVQMVSGEEFRVWRWLPSASPPPSPTHSSHSQSSTLKSSTLSGSKPAFMSTYSPSTSTANSVSSLHRSQAGLNHHQPGQQQNPKRKVWQGQAFETMEGSVNSLPCSPTPCLKIRHMFDPEIEYGETWVVATEDAVLEKCEESGAAVVHVAVDKSSAEGCVYIKCASRADAGRAYRGMHGWWFDGNLVTVKYLRLERYHERFPEASCIPPNATNSTPLPSVLHRHPSNNKRLSLQGRQWQSPIERT
ncbi:inner nuclear membrane protein Man1 isoform X2 [Hetaerina americana]|uniref:inner nuclear membrane protein Man1 isoform X2 n=1 Tax=Hetaerina americana TaxID=62018 RepID=UPI003A7F5AFF